MPRPMLNALIVAAEAHCHDPLARALAEAHANPLVVGSLDAALDRLAARSCALVFTPDHLPGRTGADICAAVRAASGGAAARIVALVEPSAGAGRRSPHQLASDGFDDILALPLDAERLSVLLGSVARAHYAVGAEGDGAAAVTGREQARARALRRLALDLAWSTSVEQLARHTLDAVRQGCDPRGAALWLRDRQQGDVRCLRASGLSDDYVHDAAPGFRRLRGKEWVALARRPELVEDVASADAPFVALALSEGFTAAITIALFTSSQVLGALVVYAADPRALSADAIEWLETVAALAAMSLDQIQLGGKLQAGAATHQRLIEQMADGVFTQDLRGNLLTTNRALADISGFSEADLELLNLADLLEPDDVARVRCLLDALATGDERAVVERVTLLRADERRIPADLSLCLVEPERAGDEPSVQGVLRDMRAADRDQRELATLRRVASVVATERDDAAAMRGVVGALSELLGYTRCGIWTLAPDGGAIVPRAVAGLVPPASVPLGEGVLGEVARTRRPAFVAADDPAARPAAGAAPAPCEICVPILDDDHLLGMIDVVSDARQPLEAHDIAFLTTLAAHLAGAMERARLYHDLERESRTDAVTGQTNRQAFAGELRRAIMAADERPVSLLVIGVDDFKQINDTYGYAIGDDLLRQLAVAMQARLDPAQLLARHTGDAFTALLPGAGRDDAVQVGEALRIGVAMQLLTAAEQVEQLSVSVGVATFPDDAADADKLLAAADHALFLAKQAGKNQVFQSNAALADLAPAYGRITDLLRQSPTETLNLLVEAMDQRLPGRRGHSERVARYAIAVARASGLPEAELADLRLAALVHDIGMLSLPDALLRKPATLSAAERQLLRGVPAAARRLLAELALPAPVTLAVMHHHERWDGAGYPDGLAGEAIPLGARIIAVADALDAMTSERAHREPLSMPQAIEQLRRGAGQQFDPAVVEAAGRLTPAEFGNEPAPFVAELEPAEIGRG